jgi:hypothetical protein
MQERERSNASMEAIRSHRDLKVWQKAVDAAIAVFEITKGFPSQECKISAPWYKLLELATSMK